LAWPIAKLLEFILGPHHGIMYRRSELKELINMHSATESHGGDLKRDTVTIIGAALDLEEKTAKDVGDSVASHAIAIQSSSGYDSYRRCVYAASYG
jgi:metal transporter CNNM